MNLRPYIFCLLSAIIFSIQPLRADSGEKDPILLELRDSMGSAFNVGDSARFFEAVRNLEDYYLSRNDLHGYYTQRCNEIVFLLNRQDVFEAYRLSIKLSRELRERKLDSELYMALNMQGHIYHFCGNKAMARKCFNEVLERMEREGYIEGMPPIYMNQVQVEIDENPDEAMRLLDEAARVAETTNETHRLVDIDTYRALCAFKKGDMKAFYDGYQKYKARQAEGYSSVHAKMLEIYYLLAQGDVAGALALTNDDDIERYDTQTYIYEKVGDWKNAYLSLKRQMQANDSINTVILSNSMLGIQNELELYEAEREAAHQRIVALLAVAACLLVIIVALFVYAHSRRRHIRELREARDRALESDRMKTAFIRNISHEIRTPLNIISGFTQVLSDDTMLVEADERRHITGMMTHNANLITTLVDELIDLSITESSARPEMSDEVDCNQLCREVLTAHEENRPDAVQVLVVSQVDDSYRLLTNRAMLRKILNALVDNALKNTEQGQVRICVERQPSAVAFAVEDTGCGIPAADAKRIFERFEKLNAFKSGLGLGLPLARVLAERLGGTLTLDTTYTGGARFVAQIPLP